MARRSANYHPWHITAAEFSHDWSPREKLHFFARYAVLAPSGHNTQPWQFRDHGETLLLAVSPDRELPFSGSLAAEPQVSLGACLETLCLAAAGFGYQLTIKIPVQADYIAAISLDKEVSPQPDLLKAITTRVSNRSVYRPEKLNKQLLQTVTTNPFKHVSLQLVDTAAGIEFLAAQTHQATRRLMTEQEFRTELSKWVRNNLTKQHDGMPGFVQGMPTPPSLLARHIVKHVDISGGQAKTDGNRVAHTPAIILLSVDKPSAIAFLEIGRLYARICVLAQLHGLNTSGVGAAVIDPGTKQAISEHFGIGAVPTALIRLGHATKAAHHSPRWPLEKVLAS